MILLLKIITPPTFNVFTLFVHVISSNVMLKSIQHLLIVVIVIYTKPHQIKYIYISCTKKCSTFIDSYYCYIHKVTSDKIQFCNTYTN